MKQFLAILFGAAVVFMALSIAQEWALFRPFFLGESVVETGDNEPPEELVKGLEHFNTLLVHLYRYGGDARFFDRLPSSEGIRRALAEDLAYLESYGVRQDLKQISFSIDSVRPLKRGAQEVITHEEWSLVYRDPEGRPFNPEPMTFEIRWRYVLRETGGNWLVVAMEPVQ